VAAVSQCVQDVAAIVLWEAEVDDGKIGDGAFGILSFASYEGEGSAPSERTVSSNLNSALCRAF
jgi:hypothetical protein